MKNRKFGLNNSYNTLDPIDQIHAQGQMFREVSKISKGRKRYSSFMAVIFAVLYCVLPVVVFAGAIIVDFLKNKRFDSTYFYILPFLLLVFAFGIKTILNNIKNERDQKKHKLQNRK